MKKSIYLAAFAALALASCSSDKYDIFGESAAERLEQYKKEYHDVLVADGGVWTMEYFSNDEEPGYLFVMKFNSDGSVKIAANHKWIGNAYKEETSLWKMIADNGPVITFNSYNNLFHIFSDPANITGPNAPVNGEYDIDETGYGHDGDYEFQVLEVSEDGNSIRLLGKKKLHHIYMRRLPADTDIQAYMDEYKKIEQGLFSKEIPNLILKNLDGEDYMVYGCETGIMSIYPAAGDAVEQTRTANFIVTDKGIRFMDPFKIVNKNDEEIEIEEFTFNDDYSLALAGHEGAVLSAGTPQEYIYNNLRNWKIDTKSFDGELKTQFDKFVTELRTLYGYKSANVNEMSFDYDQTAKSYVLRLRMRISANGYETNKFFLTFSDADGGLKITFGEPADNGSALGLNAYSELRKLFEMLGGSAMKCDTFSACGPKNVTLSSGNGSMLITAI
ncbi:MAG: DUF4302 domain-containing protein [Muribaculaceae bacterium]|nr:DUF4302 domain-containing protein [Muribaculaceae bacterium]